MQQIQSEPSELVEDRLCLTLHRASRAMTAAYREVLEPLDLTYPQYTVLSVLWQSGPTTVKKLVEVLDSDYNTISPLLKRLQAKELVRRSRNGADEREVIIELTGRGGGLRDAAAQVQPAVSRATGLSLAEQDQLVGDLRRLTDHLQQARPKSIAAPRPT